jgi:hypothetical protein
VGGFPKEPEVLGSCTFLFSAERHLDDLAHTPFYDAFLGHPETDLGFGGLGCILLGDDELIGDSVDFSDPQGIGQAYRSPCYDCYFSSSFVFLPRLMALGSFFKIVF